MAFEGLKSGPVSRSFARTAGGMAALRNARTNEDAIRQQQIQLQAKDFADRLKASAQQSEEQAQQYLEVANQMIAAGRGEGEEFDRVVAGIQTSLMMHGQFLRELKEAAGQHINPDLLSNIPDGGVWVEQRLGVAKAQLEGARATAVADAESPDFEPTADMKLAEALGYEPGTDEYKSFLKERTDKAASFNDRMMPIFDKILKEEELTPGEQKMLDIYERATVEEKLFARLLGGDDMGGDGDAGVSTPQTEAPAPQMATKDQVLTSLITDLSDMPAGPERDAAVERYIAAAKDRFDVDITKDEADALLAMFQGATPGNAAPIVRP